MPSIVSETDMDKNAVHFYLQSDHGRHRKLIRTYKFMFQLEECDYQFLANGNHSAAYLSSDGKWILKFEITLGCDPRDNPERMVRLWNLINPALPARLVHDANHHPFAWITPFIEGTKPSQQEIAQKAFSIYRNTGRIVADAYVTANFKKTADGNVVCIDVGEAYQLEKRPNLRKNHSQTSLDAWCCYRGNFSDIYSSTLSNVEKDTRFTHICRAIKALLFLQMKRPDFRPDDTMALNEMLITKLAKWYDPHELLREEELDLLLAQKTVVGTGTSASAAAAAAPSGGVVFGPPSESDSDDVMFIPVSDALSRNGCEDESDKDGCPAPLPELNPQRFFQSPPAGQNDQNPEHGATRRSRRMAVVADL